MTNDATSSKAQDQPLLVTGGAGFIGSHLVEAFLAQGHPVVVLDDLSTGDAKRLPKEVRLERGDLRDAALPELLREERIHAVFHLAAQIDVRKSMADPLFDAEVNILGTIRLAQAAAAERVSQIVFSSTGGAIYGDPDGFAADENHPTRPYSAYGIAKLAGEKYLDALCSEAGVKVTCLRYSNVYGPRQDGRGEAGVIGIWMNRLLGGEEAVIYGDGLQSRDFIHVADVVAANRAAFESGKSGIFNIGAGVETTINELYRLVAESCGVSRPARYLPGKPGEQRRSVLDVSKAARELGLVEHVPLAGGLNATALWFRGHRAFQGL
ncbi:MAG: NAD-dependent epimerase/dehydratase family protein [Acidobacteria bacterium]|nr:NAD-dependent epimerase/dehydratase family protein [Acidobacteriota bacterium]